MFIIPRNEIKIENMRASGPGGQNVNKVATGVRARWNFLLSEKLSVAEKDLLAQKVNKEYLTKKGEIIVKSTSFRSQKENLEKALVLIHEIANNALTMPKKRKPTKPTRNSVEKRLKLKKEKSEKKQLRKIF